jgi:TPR repeat protein
MQLADAGIAPVDDSRAALRASALEHTFGRLSPQFCSAVSKSLSSNLICPWTVAELHMTRARCSVLSAWRCSGTRVCEEGATREDRMRGVGGGAVGLLALRMVDTGGTCGRDVKRMMTSVVRRVAAVHAAGTPEGIFEQGQHEYYGGSYSSAARSWGRAVDLKHVHAHALLSSMLIQGRPGVPMDSNRAFELASDGAGMGCAHSKGVLAYCLIHERSYADVIQLGRESAAAGSCMGQCVLGRCYLQGLGVVRDHAEASRLFHLAADQGHGFSQTCLGYMFRDGLGVAQNDAEAVRLFRLAAEQGLRTAQRFLARILEHGRGAAQDCAEAVRWCSLAAAKENERDKAALQRLCARGILNPSSPYLPTCLAVAND